MEVQHRDRTGILIVRLWAESDDPSGLRARIIHTLDSQSDEQGTDLAATPQDVYAAVRTWVEAFLPAD